MNVRPEIAQELLNVLTEQRNDLAMENALLIAECRVLRSQLMTCAPEAKEQT
jgi:hypothetical protein